MLISVEFIDMSSIGCVLCPYGVGDGKQDCAVPKSALMLQDVEEVDLVGLEANFGSPMDK
jgi:hypothetical protein